MFQTRITKMFGIKYPIIQGAMAYLSKAELVSAVSNAGGLGSLATGGISSLDELRREIRKTRSLTDKPFAVNLSLLPGRAVASPEELIETMIEEKVQVVESVAVGKLPTSYVDRLKEGRIKIIHKCSLARHAQSAEKQGVDAVALLSFGADGHPGMDEIASTVNIRRAMETLGIPVIMAGGVADASGFVAALALGAEGVLMGTRFLMAEECPIHPNIRQWLTQASETDTVEVDRTHGFPGRTIKNKIAVEILEMEKRGASLDEILKLRSGELAAKAWKSGDIDGGNLPCGQAIGLIHDVLPAKEIIQRIIDGASSIIESLQSLAKA